MRLPPHRILAAVTAVALLAGLVEAYSPTLTASWRQSAPVLIPMQPFAPAASNVIPIMAPVATTRCGLPGLDPQGRGTSGGTIALAPSEDGAAVADTDGNAVITLAVDRAGVRLGQRFPVGEAPAQLVLGSDGRVFVTERGGNTVSVYDPRTGRLVCRTRVADDPVGLALAPDERTLYVTSGLAHALTAIDTASFATRFVVDVPREPRGVVVTPDGARAYLAHVAGAPVSAVDLASSPPRARVLAAVPVRTERVAGSSGDALGRTWVPTPPVTPIPSQAWSLAIDTRAAKLVVPFMVNRTGREVPREIRVDVYGAGSVSPENESEKVSFALGTLDLATERWSEVLLPNARGLARGAGTRGLGAVRIPSAVAVRAMDRSLVVASMGTGELATVALDRAPGARPASTASTLAAPCGVVALSTGEELVYSLVEHAVEHRSPRGSTRVAVGADTLPPELARGRRLFYTAGDPRLSSGGLSCGGCHPDGRDDGLTWFLSHGPRQTPTLAGRLTPPFNWVGSQRSLEGNIAQTVRRLGGTGLTLMEVDALAAWVARGLSVPAREPHEPTALEHRGRELFAGAGACVTCHDPGRNFTDGQTHALGGLRGDEVDRAFDTPSLRFVGATAPYFHDGRYASLRALLADPTHRMGHVERFTPDDVAAVEAYLQTL